MSTTRVVVMGLGYVGRAVAELAARAGHEVIGFDNDPAQVEGLANLRRWTASTDPGVLALAQLVLVCVPTPLDDRGCPDPSALFEAATTIAQHAPPNVCVSLESTVDPDFAATGFARAAGLPLDRVAHAPERIDPSPDSSATTGVPRVVGGCTREATTWASAFYRSLGLEVHETSAEVAALAKLTENSQRLVNIALVGELAKLCRARDVDIDAVIDASATKPFGYQPYRARAGAGGHCVPVDPVWLLSSATESGVELELLDTARRTNLRRAREVADALLDAAPDVRTILLIGAAYKPEVSDTRESPTTRVAARLVERGCELRIHDPLTDGLAGYPNSALDEKALTWADAILVLTAHEATPIERLRDFEGPIFDASGDLRDHVPTRRRL